MVIHPVLDFPKTNLLDDLSLVRHQCPRMQNKPFLPELGEVDNKPMVFAAGYGTHN